MQKIIVACIVSLGSAAAFASSNVSGVNPQFPPELGDKVSFWFEGSSNIVTNEQGGVLQWWDCRERAYTDGEDLSSRSFAYRRALAYLPEPVNDYASVPPTLWKDEERFPGKRFVDFGELGSRKWLGFCSKGESPEQTCATMIQSRSEAGAYFAVVGFRETAGDILSDVGDYTKKGNMSPFRQESGDGKGAISTSDSRYSATFFGETRIDGRRVDPRTEKYRRGDFQLVSQNGPALFLYGTKTYSTKVSTLFNYSNANNQQGGGILGEVIAFKQPLSDTERRAVEKYLAQKWFGTAFSDKLTADGEVVVNGSMTVDTFSGDGRIVKAGGGKLTASFQDETFAGSIKLTEGSIEIDSKREPLRLEPVAGKCVTVSNGVYEARSGDDGLFEVASADDNIFLRVTPEDAAVADLKVSGAVLSLGRNATQPAFARAVDPFAEPINMIDDGGFERQAVKNNNFEDVNASESGWTPSGTLGCDVITRKGSAIFTPTNDAYIVEGLQALAIHPAHADGDPSNIYSDPTWVEQTVTAPFDGLYELTFWMTRRPGANRDEGVNNVRGEIFMDGERVFYGAVSTDWRTDQDFFKQYAVDIPLTAGEHVIRLSIAGNRVKNRAVLYDDVRLKPIKKGVFVKIPNPGFESCNPITTQSTIGWFAEKPTEASWQFVTGSGTRSRECGITQHSTWWAHTIGTEADVLRDYRKAYIHFDDYMTNTITVARSGKYVFSMRYSNRAAKGWDTGSTGGARDTGHAIQVLIGGVEIGRAYPTDHHQRVYNAVCNLEAGTYELKIAGVNAYNDDGSTKDTTSVIDDVRLQLYEDPEAVLKEGDFLDNLNGAWEKSGDGPAAVVDGVVALGPNGSIVQTIEVPSNGWYFAEFSAYGMTPELTSVDGVYNGALWYPQEIAVKIDGRTVGTARPEDDNKRRYTFSLGYLTAGAHEFSFAGTESAGENARAYLTDTSIRALVMPECNAADFNMQEAKINLCGGAKLDLQFIGTARLGELRIDGERTNGLFSAETASDMVAGPGCIYVAPRGTVVTIR